jgi:hypothetical protein
MFRFQFCARATKHVVVRLEEVRAARYSQMVGALEDIQFNIGQSRPGS